MSTNVAAIRPQTAATPFTMDNPVFDGEQFANMMAVADIMAKAKLVPEHLQGKPADCLLVVEQARRWNMSPFAVAQETYVVKGKLLFGGKLVTAVVNSRAPLAAPLQFTFKGEGLACEVTVSGTLRNEAEPRTYSITVGEAKKVAGSSSLWNTDPKQQACYFGARFWARRHCPEVILGVWSEDEIDRGPTMRDITPPAAESTSLKDQLRAQAADVVDEPIDAETGEVLPPEPPKTNGTKTIQLYGHDGKPEGVYGSYGEFLAGIELIAKDKSLAKTVVNNNWDTLTSIASSPRTPVEIRERAERLREMAAEPAML